MMNLQNLNAQSKNYAKSHKNASAGNAKIATSPLRNTRTPNINKSPVIDKFSSPSSSRNPTPFPRRVRARKIVPKKMVKKTLF